MLGAVDDNITPVIDAIVDAIVSFEPDPSVSVMQMWRKVTGGVFNLI